MCAYARVRGGERDVVYNFRSSTDGISNKCEELPKEIKVDFDPDKFVKWWNAKIDLVPIVELTENQVSTICRLIERYGKEEFQQAIEFANTRDFYTGGGGILK